MMRGSRQNGENASHILEGRKKDSAFNLKRAEDESEHDLQDKSRESALDRRWRRKIAYESRLDETKEYLYHLHAASHNAWIIKELFSSVDYFTTNEDRNFAAQNDARLTYGEIHPASISKLLESSILPLRDEKIKVVYDLGSGIGKIPIQLFLESPNLEKVVGVEISYSRFGKAVDVCREKLIPKLNSGSLPIGYLEEGLNRVELQHSKSSLTITGNLGNSSRGARKRILEFRHGNIFEQKLISEADMIFFMVDIEVEGNSKLAQLLANLKCGCFILSFRNLSTIEETNLMDLGIFKALCTWNYEPGASLYVYRKLRNL